MRVLANMGLISLTAHRGASVTKLTADRAREIYTLRALLESFAARTATEDGRIDAAAMELLESRHETLVQAARTTDVGAMVEADIQFHLALSALSGHTLLLEHLAAIQTDSRRFLMYSDLYQPDAGEVVRRHRSLLETVRTRDPIAIEEAVRSHVGDVGVDIVARLSATQPTEPIGGSTPGGTSRTAPDGPAQTVVADAWAPTRQP